jgi:hypothetical protein
LNAKQAKSAGAKNHIAMRKDFRFHHRTDGLSSTETVTTRLSPEAMWDWDKDSAPRNPAAAKHSRAAPARQPDSPCAAPAALGP